MKIIIKKAVAQKCSYAAFVEFGVSKESWESWREEREIDLAKLSKAKIDLLEAVFTKFKNVKGVGIILNDIAQWRKMLKEGSSQLRARSVRQFEPLAKEWLRKIPGHRLYKRNGEEAMFCYYVTSLAYHPPSEQRDYRRPASVSVNLVWEEEGGSKSTSISFEADDCINVPVIKAFAENGYIPENEELRAEYLKSKQRFVETVGLIGKQHVAHGRAYQVGDDRWSRMAEYDLDRNDGAGAKVVVDVFRETDEKNRERDADLHVYFWPNVDNGLVYDEETDSSELADDTDDDVDSNMKAMRVPVDEDTVERPVIEVPIHPWVTIFDLTRHERLRVHVNQLTPYVYDKEIADKLILPTDQKALVKLLIDTKAGAFSDIVKGKSGGSVILLTGAPGVGKTLTAEVYAENEERPLYSVQCSQLGTEPDDLEKALMQVFARAKRWDAVMLLDEADVYVHERGNDMQQNAIVGVFLRVLEYQATVLFLTTNRPEDVDDAIASRCIARLNYVPPASEDAKRIWRVLSDSSRIKIDDEVIEAVVFENPEMTGRDIKNLLKLARLMPEAADGITKDMVEYVKQFKPTGKVFRREKAQAQAAVLAARKEVEQGADALTATLSKLGKK